MVFRGKRAEKGPSTRRGLGFLAVFLISATAFGDGGTLFLRTVKGHPEGRDAYLDGTPLENNTISPGERASLRLDGSSPEDVRIFESEGRTPVRLILTDSKPRRLFCDVNGDGEYQPDEIYFAAEACDNVRLPYPARDDVPFIVVQIWPSSFFRHWQIHVTRISSVYQGKLTFGDYECPARLVFRSPFPKGDVVNEVVIVDTQEDGIFDPLTDEWFSSEGIGVLNGDLWTVSTTFSDDRAEVTLTPYTGPTGHLNIEGEGLQRLSLRMLPGEDSVGSQDEAFEICLPRSRDKRYALPGGSYQVAEVLLRSEQMRSLFYHTEMADPPVGITIVPGATTSLAAGGPLKGKVTAGQSFLSNTVRLEFEGCVNQASIEFEPASLMQGTLLPPDEEPLFEIRDVEGKTLHSGKFDYG